MKIRIFFAFVAILTIIFLSCNWFRSPEKEISSPLTGAWKLDSIRIGIDKNLTQFFIIAAIRDSIKKVNISFTKDAILFHETNDSAGYFFDEKTNRLIIRDSTNQTLSFAKVNDSIVSLTTKDSVTLFLKKN